MSPFLRASTQRRANGIQPAVEALEDRNLLAVSAYVSSGTLHVNCDNSATNNATLTQAANGEILLNGQSIAGRPTVSSVSHIRMQGGTGNDTLWIELPGYTGTDWIYGNAGNDMIVGGPGNSWMIGGVGNDELWGHGGWDTAAEDADATSMVAQSNSSRIGTLTLSNRLNLSTGQRATEIDDFFGIENVNLAVSAGRTDGTTIDARDFNGSARLSGAGGDDLLWGARHATSTLYGNGGRDVLVGGDTIDYLYGGAGRDLLIGRHATDRLHGGTDDDILISGWTDYDDDATALGELRSIWSSSSSFDDRVDVIQADTNGIFFYWLDDDTVHSDGSADHVYGGTGRDLFYAHFDDPLFASTRPRGGNHDYNGSDDEDYDLD